jgi:lipoprotein signal peptidase
MYPIFLDLVTIFNPGVRTSQTVNLAGVFYTLDVNLTFMFASILIWVLYKLADVAIEVGELIAGNPPKEVEIKPKSK